MSSFQWLFVGVNLFVAGVLLYLLHMVWDVLCLLPARRLKEQGRDARAYRAFEHGLRLIPPWKKDGRAMAMIELAQAAQRTGDPDTALRWTDRVLADKAPLLYRMLAHNTASTIYRGLGRNEEAENHVAQALALKDSTDKKEKHGELLGMQHAALLVQQGKLTEALAACENASDGDLLGAGGGVHIKANCLLALGRPDEALEALRRARETPTLKMPGLDSRDPKIAALERQLRAIYTLNMAMAAADAGRLEEALGYLREAEPDLASDKNLGLLQEATAAWLFALNGQREDAMRKMEQVEELSTYAAVDPRQQIPYLTLLARAAYALEDFSRTVDYVEQYLALRPDVVTQAEGAYYRGECRLRLGDREAARSAFLQAVATQAETVYVRRAEACLREEFSDSVPPVRQELHREMTPGSQLTKGG